jgi:hypothetical protein
VFRTLLLLEAADPSGAPVVRTVPPQHGMHLIHEELCEMPEMLIGRLTIKLKEVANGKGVGP